MNEINTDWPISFFQMRLLILWQYECELQTKCYHFNLQSSVPLMNAWNKPNHFIFHDRKKNTNNNKNYWNHNSQNEWLAIRNRQETAKTPQQTKFYYRILYGWIFVIYHYTVNVVVGVTVLFVFFFWNVI